MALPSNNRRKSSDVISFEKNKFTTKHNETKNGTHNKLGAHEYMDVVKKSNLPIGMNVQRKSDAEKLLYANTQRKGNHTHIAFY
jgi:hypothetical protein